MEVTEQKLAELNDLKLEGSVLLKAGDYKAALRKYHTAHMTTRAVISQKKTAGSFQQFFQHAKTKEEEAAEGALVERFLTLHVALLSNMALCHHKNGNNQRVVDLCSDVLTHDENNIKALWRRASAYKNLKKLSLALADVEKGLSVDPKNGELLKLQSGLAKLDKELQKKGDKWLGGNLQSMFGKEKKGKKDDKADDKKQTQKQHQEQEGSTSSSSSS